LEDLGVAGKIILKRILKMAGKLVDSKQSVQDKGYWLARVENVVKLTVP
jgi:hypothetical protein